MTHPLELAAFTQMVMKTIQTMQAIGLSLLASVAFSSLAEGGSTMTMTYTATGGLISGTIGGTPFINATWTITADGDAAAVQSATLVVGPHTLPYYYVPVAPMLTIDDGISPPWVANLLDSGPLTWNAVSLDYATLAPFDLNGFLELGGGGSPFGAVVISTPGYNNLASEVSFSGTSAFNTFTYSTSLGNLVITDEGDGLGTFTAVPETSTTVPTLALIVGGLMLRRRSVRH